jgi:hypothetical protein
MDRVPAPAQPLDALAEMWFARRDVGAVPARAEFAPQDVRPWMGWIAIFQAVDRAPLRLQVRLHGTHLAAKTGYDLTGKVLPDDVPGDCRPFMAGMALALDRALPVYEWLEVPGVLTYARLVLPVASTGSIADTLLTSTNAADLRRATPPDVSLVQAVGQHAGAMQRRVLTDPVGQPLAEFAAGASDGPDAHAP